MFAVFVTQLGQHAVGHKFQLDSHIAGTARVRVPVCPEFTFLVNHIFYTPIAGQEGTPIAVHRQSAVRYSRDKNERLRRKLFINPINDSVQPVKQVTTRVSLLT